MKSSLMCHKGYYGSIEPSLSDGVLKGRALFIADEVTYEAVTVAELQPAFEQAIDDYLESCQMQQKSPEKPFRGQFNVRVAPELHKSAALRAQQERTSLNTVVVNALRQYLEAAHVTLLAPER
ncbi:MAG: type II toxin-antitoxin system HicB family antitoxin [Orrella sp.]